MASPIGAISSVLGIIGCASAGCVGPSIDAPVTGPWGGEHIELVLDRAHGRIAYDCAAGTIDGPVVAARDGTFAANGTHTPSLGGPERVGYVPPSYPARYNGTVSRDTMTLRVAVPSRGLALGPFRLRRDAPARLLRCL